MKVAPVSADLLIKLAIGGAVAYGVYTAYKSARGGVDAVGATITDTVNAVLHAPVAAYEATISGAHSFGDWINNTGESITQARDDAFGYVVNNIPNQIKPTSDQNLINQGVNAVGAAVSGSKSWTLGGWIYDVTH